MIRRHARPVLVAAAAVLALAGCSGEQSTEQACRVLQSTVQDSAAALEEGMAGFEADPDAAFAAMDEANAAFAAAVDDVSNEEVRQKAEPANDALVALADATGSLAEDPTDAERVEAFTGATIDVQTTFEEIGTVCG